MWPGTKSALQTPNVVLRKSEFSTIEGQATCSGLLGTLTGTEFEPSKNLHLSKLAWFRAFTKKKERKAGLSFFAHKGITFFHTLCYWTTVFLSQKQEWYKGHSHLGPGRFPSENSGEGLSPWSLHHQEGAGQEEKALAGLSRSH